MGVITVAFPEIPTLAVTPTFPTARRAGAMPALLGRHRSNAKPSCESDLNPRDRDRLLEREEPLEIER